MKPARSGLLLVAVLAVAAALFVYVTSAGFPDVGATHFDAQGRPNAAMSRAGYRGFMAFLIVVIPLMVAGLPALLARHWPMLLNIPHREYWLAPERRDETLASIRARTAVIASATILLLCFVHFLVLSANASERPELDQRMLLLGLGFFAAFMVGWIVALYRRFRLP